MEPVLSCSSPFVLMEIPDICLANPGLGLGGGGPIDGTRTVRTVEGGVDSEVVAGSVPTLSSVMGAGVALEAADVSVVAAGAVFAVASLAAVLVEVESGGWVVN